MFNTPTRNHFTFILERIGTYLFLILVIIGNMITSSTQNITDLFRVDYWKEIFTQVLSGDWSVLLSAAGGILLLVIIVLVSVFRWSRTCFHIDGEMLFSERKTLMRKTSKLPIGSITTVNVEQNVFERMVGTAKVKVDINSAVTANRTDFIFILKFEDAQRLKTVLMAKKQAEQTAAQPPKTLLAAFGLGDAVKHILLSVPLAQIIVGFVALYPLFFSDTALQGKDLIMTLAFLAVVYGFSLVMSILNLADFRLETDGERIFISHGMLRKQTYGFEKNRVKAVFLKQSLLARFFGLCSVELAVVGLGNEKNESPRLCLLVKKDRAEQLVHTLLPEFSAVQPPIVSSKTALIPAFFAVMLCTALAALVIFYYPLYGWILTAVVLVFGSVCGVLSQKTRTVRVEENLFCCSAGILNKKTGRFRYCDLQEALFHTNAVMQKADVGRIGFSILSAKNTSKQKTGWFKKEIYTALCEKIMAAPDVN